MRAIVHLTSTLDRGGIASSLCYLLPQLGARSGWRVDAAVLRERGHFARSLERQGISLHHLGVRRRYDPRTLSRLVGLLRRGRYGLVHVHGFPDLYWVALASCIVRGVRYITTEHNVTNRRRQLVWLRPVERWVYGRYDRVIAVSEQVSASFAAWLPQLADRMRVVHNGVDISEWNLPPEVRVEVRAALRISPGEPVLLFVGGLHRRKGLDVLLRAAANPSLPPCLLLVCGGGELGAGLRALAADLGLADRARFLGHRQDVPALMAAADIFVLSSRWEGGPLVVLEAMASRVPVVATTVGAVPEIIQNGKEGLLVPPEDPVALAESIHKLLDDPSQACRLKQQARLRVEREFSAEAAAQKMAAVYEEVLG